MKATVLIVEDDDTAREFLGGLLRGDGYDVHEAPTMADADKCIARGEADIILLDVELPDGYGPDLLVRLHRDLPQLPVIMVTGYGDIEMAVQAMNSGAH
ncbi:MAG TPA: response regulator, partial [Anaerolineales bacterium]|nr:response regulator [Anaerolineales bacterium]